MATYHNRGGPHKLGDGRLVSNGATVEIETGPLTRSLPRSFVLVEEASDAVDDEELEPGEE